MAKKRSGTKKLIRGTMIFADIFLSVSLVGLGGYTLKVMADRVTTVGSAEVIEVTDINDEESSDENSVPEGYTTISVDTKSMYEGDLILVNNDYEYHPTGKEDLVEIGKMNKETESDWVLVNEEDYKIIRTAYQPMADMMHDFVEATDLKTVMIYGSYRSTEFQKELYENDLKEKGGEESTLVAKPGFSEHETGYAFDFTRTTDFEYDGTGEYEWYTKNCYKYGFILRYPEGKSELTHIEYEPWHFRYVGLPHAAYMTRYGICLEEYIEILRNTYSFDSVHLEIIDDDGNTSEVYYVPADSSSDKTEIPVPTDFKYTISGNNLDGFIVTIDKSPPVSDEENTAGNENSENTDVSAKESTESESEETTSAETSSDAKSEETTNNS